MSPKARASLLAPCSRLLCFHSNPKAQRHAVPSGTPTPTPTAVDLSDGHEVLGREVWSWEGVEVDDGGAADMTAVDVTVTVVVSLSLGEMDPDVLLKITLPATRGNGVLLPRVVWLHVSDELGGPQQKELGFAAVNMGTPHQVSTRRQKCKH